MRMFSIRSSFVQTVICGLMFFSGNVCATSENVEKANQWLIERVDAVGDISSDQDIATSFQSNSESLITLEAIGITPRASFTSIKQALLDSSLDDTETISRQIIHRVSNRNESQLLVDKLINRTRLLTSLSSGQTGVGIFDYYDNSVLETAFSLQALAVAGSTNSTQISNLLAFLNNQQNADGSYGASETRQKTLYLTYQSLLALHSLRARFSVQDNIDQATAAINSLRLEEGDWGDEFLTAIALLSIIPSVADISEYQSAISALRNAQDSNGSWKDDVYITALAARVLLLADNFSQATPITAGALSGSIVDRATKKILSGIDIQLESLVPSPSLELLSDDLGLFNFSNVEPGEYSLRVSATGFETREIDVTIISNQATNLGQIELEPLNGVISGIVRHQQTGEPIVGAQVLALVNGTPFSTSTALNGDYSLFISAGNINLTIQAAGFENVVVNSVLEAGAQINFSPALNVEGAEPVIGESDIRGRIIAEQSSLPLNDVLVEINGQTLSVETDELGVFLIEGVNQNTLALTFSLNNYIESSVSVLVTPSTSIDLGDITLKRIDTLNGISVSGVIIDGESQQPVAGASVNIASLGLSTISNSEGEYDISNINTTEFDVSVSAVGYFDRVGHIVLTGLAQTFFDVELQRTSAISGIAISNVAPELDTYPAFSEAMLNAVLENNSSLDIDVLLFYKIIDSKGNVIDERADELLPLGSSIEDTFRRVPANAQAQFDISWFTQSTVAGDYQVVIQAYSTQGGQLLAENTTVLTIEETRLISGITQFDPPIAQLAAQQPINLTAALMNRGNVDLSAGTVTAQVSLKNAGSTQRSALNDLYVNGNIDGVDAVSSMDQDEQGNTYAFSRSNRNITKISPSGTTEIIIADIPSSFIDFDTNDNKIYLVDSAGDIEIYDENLIKTTIDSDRLNTSIEHIEVTKNGNIFVASSNSIYQIFSDGTANSIVQGGLSSGYRDIVKNSNGDFFLSDVTLGKVFKFSNGLFSEFANIDSAHGLDIDAQDNLYVTSFKTNGNGALLRVSVNGDVTEIASGLSEPFDVVVENNDSSFIVSERASNRIIRIDLFGNISVIANGIINQVASLKYNQNSELHVNNAGFASIEKLSPDLQVETLFTGRNGLINFDSTGAATLHITNNGVNRINSDGTLTLLANTSGLTVRDYELFNDQFLIADSSGSLHLSDSSGNLVEYYQSPLKRNNLFAVADDQSIYTFSQRVSNDVTASIVKLEDDGRYSRIFVDTELDVINDFRTDNGNDFYLNNRSDKTILKFSEASGIEVLATLEFTAAAIALDTSNNRLFVTEANVEKVYTVNLITGEIALYATMPERILTSSSFGIDASGQLWMLSSTSRVMRVSSDGTPSIFNDLGIFNQLFVNQQETYGVRQADSSIYSIATDGLSAQSILNNEQFVRNGQAFAVTNGQTLHTLVPPLRGLSSIRYSRFDMASGERVNDYASTEQVRNIATLNGEIKGLTSDFILDIKPNKLSSIELVVANHSFIESDPLNNAFVIASSSSVQRYDPQASSLTPLKSDFFDIDTISVAPNGNIALAHGTSNNAVSILSSQGDIISDINALLRPTGILKLDNNDILVSNAAFNRIDKISGTEIVQFSDQAIQRTDFINRDSVTGDVFFPLGTSIIRFNESTNQSQQIVLSSLFGRLSVSDGVHIEGNTLHAVNNLIASVVGFNAFGEFDLATRDIGELASGFSDIVDIQSFNNDLFALDFDKSAVLQVTIDGVSELVSTGLSSPQALFLDAIGNQHISYSAQRIAVFERGDTGISADYDLQGTLPAATSGRTIQLTFLNGQYLFGFLERVDTLTAQIDTTANTEFSEGDVLFTATQDITSLPIDSESIDIDFGDWTPPIDGDFEIKVTHSDVDNALLNILHVGASAQGDISIASDAVYPGNQSINGVLEIIGADFTAISQVDTGGIRLAASSGANGRAIAGDSNGNIYAASTNKIVKVTDDGVVSDFVTGITVGNGLSVDEQNNLYAISGFDILKITATGEVTTFTTLPTTASFVIVDYDNVVYASDQSGIYRVNANGENELFVSIANVRSLSKDRFDNMYVLTQDNRILKVLSDGSVTNYYTDARYEYEGVNMVNDCADNVLFAPIQIDGFKTGGEEDQIIQITGSTREVSSIFFGPAVAPQLADIDVLYFDRINQRLLMYSDVSVGQVFSFPLTCGAIDVDVSLITRDDVDLSFTQPAPSSQVDLGNGQIQYRWNLDQIANTGQKIELKYLFKNLLVDETRPALQEAFFEFTNSFLPDQVIKVPLAIPSITVEQPVELDLVINKTEFLAFDELNISHTALNISDVNFDGSIEFALRDSEGQLVRQFEPITVQSLAGLSDQRFVTQFNIDAILQGRYTLTSTLINVNGNQIAQASASFDIIEEPLNQVSKGVTVRTLTDKATYYINDSVEISDLVENISNNNIVTDVLLVTEVFDANNQPLFNNERALSGLTPGASNVYISAYSFTSLALGDYRVVSRVIDTISGNELTIAETAFSIENDLNLALLGDISLSSPQVFQGEPLMCFGQIQNTGSLAVTEQQVRQLLLNVDNGNLVSSNESTQTIDLAGQQTVVNNIDTSALTPSNYSCALQALIDGQWVNLANDFFVVDEPINVIEIQLDAKAGDKGRVLVLLDNQQQGASTEPELVTQHAFLETLLTDAGWAHTIVTSAEDFVTEFQTGAYINYLLLSENEKISETGQAELRNAISQGQGLIEAGSQNQRQGRIDEALGVVFKGKTNSAQGVSLFESEIATSDNIALLIPENVLRAELNGATKVAQYIPEQAKGNQDEPPAITIHEFADGKSVYFGFDLLSEATLLNSTQSELAQLIVNALAYVNNPALLERAGVSRSVQFSVSNVQQATPARLVVTLPAGTELIDVPEAASIVGDQVIWLLDLNEQETITTELWLTQPEFDVTINAIIESGQAPDVIEQDSVSVELIVQQVPDDAVVDLGIAQSFNAFMCQDFTSRSSDAHGRLAAGGDISIDSYGVATRLQSQPDTATLIAGGNLSYGQGKIFVGSALVGGSADNVNQTVVYGLEDGATIDENATIDIDFEAEFAKLRQLSSDLAQVPSTGTIEYKYGGVYLTGDCSSDTHVFNLDGATVLRSNHLVLSCVPSTSTIIFNIDGERAGFKNIGLSQLHNQASKILYNFYQATTVEFTHVGIEGSVLAPLAHFDNPRGQVNGSIIGKSWNGPMELHDFPFIGSLEAVLNNVLNGQ